MVLNTVKVREKATNRIRTINLIDMDENVFEYIVEKRRVPKTEKEPLGLKD